jgi:acetyl esterase/lipase
LEEDIVTSRYLVDPELLTLLDSIPLLEMSAETLAQRRLLQVRLRQQHAQQLVAGAGSLSDVDCSERFVPGPKGAPEVRALIYTPKTVGARRPALLDIHGGGYVMGSPEGNDVRNKLWASQLDCVIVSVDYRLAPETIFPGAVEDCYAALKWLYANAMELGADSRCIAIGGGSAGGGLAAALGLLARDRGEVPIVHQQLICPMIDDRPAADPHPHTGDFLWRHTDNRFGWSSLLGHEPGGKDVSPYAAAARAENLAGLPSTFISTGALDLFLEENLDYARRLTRAGVPVELHVYPGAFHGFDLAVGSRLAKRHASDQLEALRHAFAETGRD